MFEIRPFNRKTDYGQIIKINNQIWPLQLTVEELQQMDDNRDKNRFHKRFVAEKEDSITGFAAIYDPWISTNKDYYAIKISVLPEYRRKGIGEQLYQQLIKSLDDRTVDTLMAEAYENMTEGIAFLRKKGFRQTIKLPRSLLILKNFQPQKFKQELQQVKKNNIEIITVEELAEKDLDWKQKLWQVHVDCMKDVPSTVDLYLMPFEEYVRTVLEKLDLRYWVVARESEKIVGLSILWRDTAEPKKMYTSLTGVLREYRRKKIATAMKVRLFQLVKDTPDIECIETENEENNPMFKLNIQLGFKPQPAKLGFEKKMN